MILPKDRKLAALLVRLKIWKLVPADLWRVPMVKTRWGTDWLHERMLKRQTRDGLHHAPACPGNEWSGAYLVLMACRCGAAYHAARATPSRGEPS